MIPGTQETGTPRTGLDRKIEQHLLALKLTEAKQNGALYFTLARRTGYRTIDTQLRAAAPYHPPPTIVEAARVLYAQHSVEAIAHEVGYEDSAYFSHLRKVSPAQYRKCCGASRHSLLGPTYPLEMLS